MTGYSLERDGTIVIASGKKIVASNNDSLIGKSIDEVAIQQEYTESLQSKNEQLQKALQEADRANAAKTSFLSRMSHDIRTPLNGIIGLMEVDELYPDDTALHRENHKKMKVSANHLFSLINDVLQMSKLESGELVLSNCICVRCS